MKKYTGYFIFIIIIVCIAWDVFVIMKDGNQSSISKFLIDWFYDYPVAAFAFGLVTGHLVWQMPKKKDKK